MEPAYAKITGMTMTTLTFEYDHTYASSIYNG
jgi:hypothetical protein